ncbi:hypothetical protein AAFH68_16380 [Flavobacterium sp. CGRL1]
MKGVYEYINKFGDLEINDNIVQIRDRGFIVKIGFSKKIERGYSLNDFSFNPAKHILFRKYANSQEDLVESLYCFLNRFYVQTNRVPKYNLGRQEDDIEKEFFEVFFEIDDSLTELDINSILSNNNELIDWRIKALNLNYSAIENSNLNIVQSNTKTRRLGYLKLIIELFEHSNYFPITYLSKKIEIDSFLYENDLREYGKENTGDDKGLIKKTAIGSSAQPYIDLLEELNLLTQINNSYILTKQCKVYFHLHKYFKDNSSKDNNLFQLDQLDKLFFLRQILVSDSLYIWSIIDIIFIARKPMSTMSIKKIFTEYVINELELNQQYSQNNTLKKKILVVKSRITSWKKPLTYLEHIVEPRINWLVDLGILELNAESKEKQYFFTKEGLNLVAILCQVFSKKLNKQLVLKSFMEMNYLSVFNYIFGLSKEKISAANIKIEEYLLEAFKIFKTEAPNKIAASQAIDYVCFKLFLVDGFIIEFEDLKKYLEGSNVKFSMDWFKTENDGALYLKK